MYEFSRGSWTATILLIFMALSYFADFPRIVLLKHTKLPLWLFLTFR